MFPSTLNTIDHSCYSLPQSSIINTWSRTKSRAATDKNYMNYMNLLLAWGFFEGVIMPQFTMILTKIRI